MKPRFYPFRSKWLDLLNKHGLTQADIGREVLEDQHDFSRRLWPTPLKEKHFEKICDMLGVDSPLEFGGFDLPIEALRSIDHIEYLYTKLGEGDILTIVSAEGFLEAHDNNFFAKVTELLQKGVEVRYFYPARETISKSIIDFETLWRLFNFVLRNEPEALNRVYGFKVASSGLHLFGHNARHVLFSYWEGNSQVVRETLLYAETAAETGDPRCWIRLPVDAGGSLLRELARHAEPINRLGLPFEDRMNYHLQDAYRTSWNNDIPIYKELRKEIKTKDKVQTAIKIYFETWKHLRGRRNGGFRIRYLDVGAGDGEMTHEICQSIQAETQSVWITPVLLESAGIRPNLQSDFMKLNCHIQEPLEKARFDGRSFDLISVVHAFYLMDPRNLLTLYDWLSEDGWLLIVHAPFKGDVLNVISAFVDLHVLRDVLDRTQPYDGKKIKADPYRTYAEDIKVKLRQYFGDGSFKQEPISEPIPRHVFLDASDRATDLALRTAHMFTHGRSKYMSADEWPEDLRDGLASAIAEVVDGDTLPNDVWIFSLFKKEVHYALAKSVHGIDIGMALEA